MFEDVQLSVICHGSELEESGVSYLGEQMGEMWRMRTGKTQHRVRKTQNEICFISTKPQGTFFTRLYTNKLYIIHIDGCF